MSNWSLRLDDYEIEPERYHELKWTCRQYDRYKEKLEAMRRGEVDRISKGNGVWHGRSDPVASEAQRLADCFEARRVRAIEQAAVAADPQLCKYILVNVTRNKRFEELGVPCGRNQFFEARRRFFAELDDRLRE